MTVTTAEARAKAMIKSQTTRLLIDTFVLTTNNNDPHIYTVRGWIMDELESRSPETFEAWLLSDDSFHDETLYEYYNC